MAVTVAPRPQLYGRPGTKVIPQEWVAAAQPPVAGTRTAKVALRRPGGVTGALDEDTGLRVTTPHASYADVSCRVTALTANTSQVAPGENPMTVSGYQVAVDLSVPAAVGDLAVITESGDPLLDGRKVLVVELVRGSLVVERVLLVELVDDH